MKNSKDEKIIEKENENVEFQKLKDEKIQVKTIETQKFWKNETQQIF